MLPVQWELCLCVIKRHRAPRQWSMAGSTLRTEDPIMLVVLTMASNTALRRITQFITVCCPQVAVPTGNLLMGAFQRKFCSKMLKIRPIRFEAIMTTQAGPIKNPNMLSHASFIEFPMTIPACFHMEILHSVDMAIQAGNALPILEIPMCKQREPHALMEVVDGVISCNLCICSLMLCMATSACDGRLQARVEGAFPFRLISNLFVAAQAAIRHTLLTPKCRMACGAVLGEPSMAGHTPEDVLTGCCRQRSRTEQSISAEHGGANDPCRCQNCGHHSHGCKTA